jgi:hypothetical protein
MRKVILLILILISSFSSFSQKREIKKDTSTVQFLIAYLKDSTFPVVDYTWAYRVMTSERQFIRPTNISDSADSVIIKKVWTPTKIEYITTRDGRGTLIDALFDYGRLREPPLKKKVNK